jgi:large subunit ribosomal protein L1
MAKDKTTEVNKEVQAGDEEIAELEEVREDAPEIDLPAEAPGSEADEERAKAVQEDSEEKLNEGNLTKAGKRSAKAVREAQIEEARLKAKEERTDEEKEADDAPKAPKRPTPNPLHQHSKKYREVAKQLEVGKAYSLAEALDLAQKTSTTKFDSSVELHVNLGVDPRQADQMVRSSVVLPHGTGKTLRIAVYADGKAATDATEAGADVVGSADLFAKIEKGQLDFDILIATPAGMAALGKVAKVLGPRGLMPNPKSGTVTPDVATAVKDAKGGKVEFRIDKQAILHQVIGKVSFSTDKLQENATTFLSAVLRAKPASAKGTYVRAIAASTSMGPGIKLDAAATISAVSTNKR